MKAKSRTARAKTARSSESANARGKAPNAKRAQPAKQDHSVESEPAEKNAQVRRAILDAAIACFAEHGWSGANMSVIARRCRMTRGRIQYYFPTLDDLLPAAIDHLNAEWQQKYFNIVGQVADTSARFETGVDALWRLMQDPLHVAKQELESSARTNAGLRALMQKAARAEEAMSVPAAKLAYPELARKGDAALRLARHFTLVFMEGLSTYRFSRDSESWRAALIDMLKSMLTSYWTSLGVTNLTEPPADPDPHDILIDTMREENRARALALIHEAAALLAADAPAGAHSKVK